MEFTLCVPTYQHNSAGIVCLYRLAELLTDLGHKCYGVNWEQTGGPKPPWCRIEFIAPNPQNNNIELRGVIIVPEIFPDVVINAPVVRWCLNKPGLLGGPTKYHDYEIVFHFGSKLEESARAASFNGESVEFIIGQIDLDEIRRPERNRDLEVWYEGKGKAVVEIPDALHLTSNWPPTRKELFDLLARTRTFWSFDNFTIMLGEAQLAGCKVMVWQEGSWEPYQDYEKDVEPYVMRKDRDLARTRKFVRRIESCVKRMHFKSKIT
jgi:hypothetical protein